MPSFVDYSAQCFHMSLDRHTVNPVGETRPIVMRMNASTFRALLTEPNFASNTPFEDVTHLLIDGLYMDREGWVTVGNVNRFDFEDETTVRDQVLTNPKTYTALLKQLQKKHPHLRWIWQVPRLGLNDALIERVDHNPPNLLFSLEMLYHQQDVPIDGFAMSFAIFDTLSKYPGIWADWQAVPLMTDWCDRPMTLWCTIEHEMFGDNIDNGVWELNSHAKRLVNDLLQMSNLEYFVIPTFGMLTQRSLFTNRGIVHWYEIGPDSALADYVQRLNSTWSSVPRNKILMELDTSGICFTRDPFHPNRATGYRLTTYKDIHRKVLMAPTKGFTLGGSSLVESHILEDDCYTSYDNPKVRETKLMYAKNNLKGVVLGDMNDDLSIEDPRCLLKMATALLSV